MRLRRALPWSLAAIGTLLGIVVLYELATWPDVASLRDQRPASTAFIERYQVRQRGAGKPDRVAWEWVPYREISAHLKRAVVAAEDMEFFFHDGFSTSEMRAALKKAWEEKEAPRGASTITQQLAKNLWLSPSRSPLRKLREALLTRQLERQLTKSRILELYLNVVEFGPGVYGAEAAARRYFGTSASALSEHESAQLAASLPRPSSWHPGVESRSYARYVIQIEQRMARAEFLWRYVGREDLESLPPLPDTFEVPLDLLTVPAETLVIPADTLPTDTVPATR